MLTEKEPQIEELLEFKLESIQGIKSKKFEKLPESDLWSVELELEAPDSENYENVLRLFYTDLRGFCGDLSIRNIKCKDFTPDGALRSQPSIVQFLHTDSPKRPLVTLYKAPSLKNEIGRFAPTYKIDARLFNRELAKFLTEWSNVDRDGEEMTRAMHELYASSRAYFHNATHLEDSELEALKRFDLLLTQKGSDFIPYINGQNTPADKFYYMAATLNYFPFIENEKDGANPAELELTREVNRFLGDKISKHSWVDTRGVLLIIDNEREHHALGETPADKIDTVKKKPKIETPVQRLSNLHQNQILEIK